MRYTINSRIYGEVTFSNPGGYYIYVDLNGKPGSLGKQICEGGACTGHTISFSGDSYDDFKNICKRWWRSYLKNTRDMRLNHIMA